MKTYIQSIRISLIAITLFGIICSSCSKSSNADAADTQDYSTAILGKWTIYKHTIDGATQDLGGSWVMEFDTDNTGWEYDDDGRKFPFTWSIKGNHITITDKDNQGNDMLDEYTLQKLTSKEMDWAYTGTYYQSTQTFNGVFYYKR